MIYSEFLELTALSERTLRHWVANGLMPQPVDGHYTQADVWRVWAITRLKEEFGIHSLSERGMRVDAMTPAELEAFANHRDIAPQPTILEAPPAGVTEIAPEDAVTVVALPTATETWTHLTLKPGLVLQVKKGSTDEVRSLARAIATLCGTEMSFD